MKGKELAKSTRNKEPARQGRRAGDIPRKG